jgi:hypothetical protein
LIPTLVRRALACALFLALVVIGSPGLAQPRAQHAWNADWRMKTGDIAGAQNPSFDDRDWTAVTLPRAFNEDLAFKADIKDLPGGVTWYRKRFTLPQRPADGKVFIEFEGVRQAGEVFVNGTALKLHENGITAFGVDASCHIRPGENVVAVRVDSDWRYRERASGSGFQWNNQNFNANYGGINRNVRLHLTGGLYQTLPLYSSLGTTGVYVWADGFDVGRRTATVHAESEVKNETGRARTFQYRVGLRDAEGRPAGQLRGPRYTLKPGETRTVSASGRINNLNLWSWGYGYLYSVDTDLVENGRSVDRVTTRTGFRKTQFADGKIWLNDRVTLVHGYAQRTTNEWPALGVDIPPWVSDFSNALMVESGGNLVRWMHTAPSRQDVASSDRVGLMQAMPAGDAEGDVTGRRWEQRVEVMRDAIVYFRNNPSIIFYESGNENISEPHMAEMKAVRDRFDPHGGRAIGSREMLNSTVAEYGGEMLYVNKSASQPLWATEYSRDEGARKFQDDFTPPFHKDAPAYNRNQDSHAVENVTRWYDFWRERPGTGRRVSAGGVNIIFSDSNTHYRGDNNYRRSGEVDAMRLPKQGFYAHQVMWDGWVEPERSRTHIIGHWNYAPDVVKDVQVVSSAERVELFLNGRSLGNGVRSDHFLFTFPKVAYAPGTLRAVGYDASGRQASTMELVTVGAPVAVKLTPRTSPLGWRADGSDLALVDVEVVDAQGRRAPTALNMIKFTLDGPAEWRGGIAQGPDNYILSKTLPVEAGVNRVSIRSLNQPGTVRLTAAAEGLQPATIQLATVAPRASDGVSPVIGDDLPVQLGRGPTPRTPAFRPMRTSIAIAGVTAGSNAAAAQNSIDDDELSFWASEDDLSKAWIEYDLGQAQPVGDLTLKLTGWRIRNYTLRITLDGRTVFEGETAKTLGYVTLPLNAGSGRRLRVALIKPTVDRDAFGNIIEVAAPRAGMDTQAEKVKTGGILSVIEAEVYRPTVTSARAAAQ